MPAQIHLVVCGHFLREARQALDRAGFPEIDVIPYPTFCGQPQMEWSHFQEIIAPYAQTSDTFCIFGGGCLKSLGPVPAGYPKCQINAASTCFELFVPGPMAHTWVREGAYLTTPGWLIHWREKIQRWGFEQETARAYFAESCQSIDLLDTGVAADAAAQLEKFASFVARPSRVAAVGVDYFSARLKSAILTLRMESDASTQQASLASFQRVLSDYAIGYDLVGRMTSLTNEKQVLDSIFELYSMLFAPARMIYTPVDHGKWGAPRFCPASAIDPAALECLASFPLRDSWIETPHGFVIRMGSEEDPVGLLKVEDVAFPEYKQHYTNLAVHLAKVCALAIQNARTYQRLQDNIGELESTLAQLQKSQEERDHLIIELKSAIARIKTLSGLVPICASCKKIRDDKGYWNQIESYVQRHTDARFSHGICPDCARKLYPGIYENSET